MLRRCLQPTTARPVSGHGMVETVAVKDFLIDNHEDEEYFTIGRTPNNSLVLDHDELPLLISRKHARFSMENGRITLWDLGATNGTWINDVKLPPQCSACLHPGDTVSFGGPACVMRQGRPVQNPFQYVFEEPLVTDSDSEVEIVEIEGSEPLRLERPSALSRLVESDGRPHLALTRDGSVGSEEGSPMVIAEVTNNRQPFAPLPWTWTISLFKRLTVCVSLCSAAPPHAQEHICQVCCPLFPCGYAFLRGAKSQPQPHPLTLDPLFVPSGPALSGVCSRTVPALRQARQAWMAQPACCHLGSGTATRI